MINTLILPESINHDFYREVIKLVLERQEQRANRNTVQPLSIYCCGSGGESRPTLAIANAIRMDGDCIGVMIGAAASSTGVIWASCQSRFVFPNAKLGIHPVAWNGADGIFNHRRLGSVADEFRWLDEEICRVYASASNKPFEWWWERYISTAEMDWIGADEMVEIQMARLWAETNYVAAQPPAHENIVVISNAQPGDLASAEAVDHLVAELERRGVTSLTKVNGNQPAPPLDR